MPRFSILTPTRKRSDWLAGCTDSVLAQGFSDFEQIVYDNGPEPNPWSAGPPATRDPRIRYVWGPAEGPADAFNKALALARGEIVHPLADDDRLAPDALEVVDAEIGDAEWLNGLTRAVGDTDRTVAEYGSDVWGEPVDVDRLERGYYLGGAIYWKRELTARLGGFDPAYDGAADYDLYLRFAQAAPAKFVDRVLYVYTDHPDTDSRTRSRRQADASRRIRARCRAS